MLVVAEQGRIVAGALAFRRDSLGVTLRVISREPGSRGTGLGCHRRAEAAGARWRCHHPALPGPPNLAELPQAAPDLAGASRP